jgi:uncharacterized protein (TIGR00162 family)
MTTRIIELEKPKLKNPVFVEGLPGIGNVGRIAAGYLVEELKAKKFAELLSSHFMPFVFLHKTAQVHLLRNEFYYYKGKDRDLIILIGDCQSSDPEGHYEVAEEIVKYVKKFGVKEMFTLAGWSVGEPVAMPKVIGAVNDKEMIKKYEKCGIDFKTTENLGTIVGASGLLLGIGKYYGIKGLCLLGETAGYPILPDHKSAREVLNVLCKILGLKIDTSKLEKKVKEMEEIIRRMQEVQAGAFAQIMKPAEKPEKEKLSYIG